MVWSPEKTEVKSWNERDTLRHVIVGRADDCHIPWAKQAIIHSTNSLERLNKEIERRTNVVGIFSNEAAIGRLVSALMLEQNDEWAVTRSYMTLETVAAICEDQAMDPVKIATL